MASLKDKLRSLLILILIIMRKIYSALVHRFLGMANPWFYKTSELPISKNGLLIQPAHVLAAWIREGKVTSEEVVNSFITRAKEVEAINAVVDDRYSKALMEAKIIDKTIKDLKDGRSVTSQDGDLPLPKSLKNLKEEFPLLGVPFTCKESIQAKGMSNTGGLFCRAGFVADKDADVVSEFKKAGAILIGVTNVPELGLWYETSNVVYGTTKNPYNMLRTPGGSSGGESALMTAGGTPLSIGTDIGGSLRFPAYCCGLFSHKPTSSLISLTGSGIFDSKYKNGVKIIVPGPIARYTEDLLTMMEVLAPNKTKDLKSKVDSVSLKDMTIWYAEDLGSTPMFSPVDKRLVKVLHQVTDYLACQGATIKKFTVDMSMSFFYWKNKNLCEFPNEPPFQSDMTNRTGSANLVTAWTKWALLRGEHTVPVLLKASLDTLEPRPLPNPEDSKFYWRNIQSKFLNTMGSNSVLLMPPLPIIAPYHNEPVYNTFDFGFCAIFNAIDFPVTHVPLGLTPNENLPIGLQVATTPNNDHLSLAISRVLEKKFGGWQPSTLTKSDIAMKKTS